MSTAGKVLSVLSMLLAAVWVLLAAGVTQVNRSGGEAVKKLTEDVAKLEEEIAASKRQLAVLVDETYQQRLKTQSELTVLQVQQAEVEKARAQVLDNASHLRHQFESLTRTIAAARDGGELRMAEREAETKAKAEAEALVEQLKATNAELRAELDGLSERFRSSLTENQALVERLRNSEGGATTRPASLVR
ncbi:MAG: hypothetical protein AB7I30_01155 [Isosphaeraceae bacterium]